MEITHFFTYVRSQFQDQDLQIQISSTLLQVGDHNFLVDTGFANQLDVVYSLNRLGLSALDIDYVVNTHTHPDHIGGNQHFKQAEIYLSEEDFRFQSRYMMAIAQAKDKELVEVVKSHFPAFNEEQAAAYGKLSKQMAEIWQDDLVGDSIQLHFIEEDWPFDLIEAIEAPGHSPGHFCFKVNTPGKPFLITGDALSTKASFQLNQLDYPYCFDVSQYLKSQKTINEFSGIIVPGHDKPFDTETREYLEAYEAARQEEEEDSSKRSSTDW